MTEFEGQVLADLSVLKNQMDALMGVGQPGRIVELEARVDRHDQAMQRLKGVMGAFGTVMAMFHIAVDYFRR